MIMKKYYLAFNAKYYTELNKKIGYNYYNRLIDYAKQKGLRLFQ